MKSPRKENPWKTRYPEHATGMVLRVDNHEEIKAPYLRCTNAGCEVQVELTAELVAQLKGGLKLRVGIRPFGSLKTVVIDASLEGFTGAFNRLMRYFYNHPRVYLFTLV